MATQNLSLPSDPFCTDRLTAHVIAFVDRQLEAQQSLMQLDRCSYEAPESRYAAGDAVPCLALGTVHDLARETEYCVRHFVAVNRG